MLGCKIINPVGGRGLTQDVGKSQACLAVLAQDRCFKRLSLAAGLCSLALSCEIRDPVFDVKPAMVAPVLAGCGALAGAAFVSVAAGITLAQMAAALPPGAALIRCMPNTPAAIGQGMMVLCPGAGVGAATRALAERLMKSSGAVAWLEDEALMDAVTAISGSGPAYVFHFIEALTEAGRSLGLPDDLAALLAMQTVAGAGRMAQTSDEPPGVLRERVTSPGGTTAAALGVFMQDGALTRLVARATLAARDRGVELGAAG